MFASSTRRTAAVDDCHALREWLDFDLSTKRAAARMAAGYGPQSDLRIPAKRAPFELKEFLKKNVATAGLTAATGGPAPGMSISTNSPSMTRVAFLRTDIYIRDVEPIVPCAPLPSVKRVSVLGRCGAPHYLTP